MHKLTANTDGLTEVASSQQGSTDLEIRAEQIAAAAMGELKGDQLIVIYKCIPGQEECFVVLRWVIIIFKISKILGLNL